MHPTYPLEEWKKNEWPADHSWVEQWLLKSCDGSCGDTCAVHMHMHSKQVVKVIWHKAASSLQTDDSIVFTRLCQCALMGGHIGTIWWIRLNHPSVLYNGMPLSPSKLPLCMGNLDPHLTHGFLGPPESSIQMASRSVQPFLQGLLVWQTDHATRSVTIGRIYVHGTTIWPKKVKLTKLLTERRRVCLYVDKPLKFQSVFLASVTAEL